MIAAGSSAVVRPAVFPDDRAAVLAIWRDYIGSINLDLSFQGNDAEFADLPGKYAAPDGCILLAARGDSVLGCIALRRVDRAICEMKRLYVRPAGRGLGLGRMLAEAVIAQARMLGYAEMRLDVLAQFDRAQALYAALGFVDAPPVSHNPVPGTRFLGLALR